MRQSDAVILFCGLEANGYSSVPRMCDNYRQGAGEGVVFSQDNQAVACCKPHLPSPQAVLEALPGPGSSGDLSA